MWLIFAMVATLSWAVADVFYKKGAVPEDRMSHLKTVVMVGLVMGLHAFGYMLFNNIDFSWKYLVIYLPVSSMYILSMTIGYLGLRYLELSISSPVQNSSGAVTSILIYIFFAHKLSHLEIGAITAVTIGIVSLAALERSTVKASVAVGSDKKYQSGFVAIMFPVLYCIVDGLGTFADAIYLDELSIISEDMALLAYEYSFFICAVAAFIYLKRKKEPFSFWTEQDRGAAAVFETIGQFFYVFAMSQNAIIVAPLVASYSVFSVILSSIFLKEKLNSKQYLAVSLIFIGIALLAN
ncbi:MAG: EamA family transporter [Firmicutes bacterium]|nr:EamA family transporter [Bacillota bacterium]